MSQEPDRRRVLRLLAAGGCLAVTGAFEWIGCSAGGGRRSEVVTVDRDQVDREGRVVVRWQDQPVEIRADGEGYEARSLVCTHIGCTVRWVAAERHYACPCHEGYFDERGHPIGGPPTAPLRPVPLSVDGNAIQVGG